MCTRTHIHIEMTKQKNFLKEEWKRQTQLIFQENCNKMRTQVAGSHQQTLARMRKWYASCWAEAALLRRTRLGEHDCISAPPCSREHRHHAVNHLLDQTRWPWHVLPRPGKRTSPTKPAQRSPEQPLGRTQILSGSCV